MFFITKSRMSLRTIWQFRAECLAHVPNSQRQSVKKSVSKSVLKFLEILVCIMRIKRKYLPDSDTDSIA